MVRFPTTRKCILLHTDVSARSETSAVCCILFTQQKLYDTLTKRSHKTWSGLHMIIGETQDRITTERLWRVENVWINSRWCRRPGVQLRGWPDRMMCPVSSVTCTFLISNLLPLGSVSRCCGPVFITIMVLPLLSPVLCDAISTSQSCGTFCSIHSCNYKLRQHASQHGIVATTMTSYNLMQGHSRTSCNDIEQPFASTPSNLLKHHPYNEAIQSLVTKVNSVATTSFNFSQQHRITCCNDTVQSLTMTHKRSCNDAIQSISNIINSTDTF